MQQVCLAFFYRLAPWRLDSSTLHSFPFTSPAGFLWVSMVQCVYPWSCWWTDFRFSFVSGYIHFSPYHFADICFHFSWANALDWNTGSEGSSWHDLKWTVSLAWVPLMIICLLRLSASFCVYFSFLSFVPGLSRMALISFGITGWPQTCDYPSFSLWSAGIAEVCHHTLLDLSIYFWVSFDRCFGVVYYI